MNRKNLIKFVFSACLITACYKKQPQYELDENVKKVRQYQTFEEKRSKASILLQSLEHKDVETIKNLFSEDDGFLYLMWMEISRAELDEKINQSSPEIKNLFQQAFQNLTLKGDPLPLGMKNKGNTCYCNSLMQLFALSHSIRDVFNDTFQHGSFFDWYLENIEDANHHFLSGLAEFLFARRNVDVKENELGKILKSTLIALHKFVPFGRQEDVGNLADYFFGSIPNQYKNDLSYEEVFQYFGLTGEEFETTNRSIKFIKKPKKNISYLLKLELSDSSHKNLFEIIKDFSSPKDYWESESRLNSDDETDSSFAKRSVTNIDSLPKELWIFLKRFTNDSKKIDTPVAFSTEGVDTIDLFPFTTEEFQKSKKQNQATYRLKGFVVHNGTTERGHYTSYGRYGDTWYYFNDSAKPEQKELTEVLEKAQHAYIYLLELIEKESK